MASADTNLTPCTLHFTSPWRRLVAVAVCAASLGIAQANLSAGEKTELTAAGHLRAAHEGRAVWQNFPGFEATFVANQNGKTIQGTLVADSLGAVEIKVPEGTDTAWVQRALDSLIGHRLSDSDVATNVEFADENAGHPFGRLIRSKDPNEHSLWRVKGDVLTEVHRINDKTHFVISVADVARTPEGKHLPQNFSVETWNRADGRLIKSRQVHTEWSRIGGYDLPVAWWAVVNVDGEGRTVEELVITGHRLLQKTAQK